MMIVCVCGWGGEVFVCVGVGGWGEVFVWGECLCLGFGGWRSVCVCVRGG